ncbi:MAG: DUF5663 domain-containing protein [Candidatus Paceibacterota bacterium]
MEEQQKNDLLEEFDLKNLPEEAQSRILQAMTETLLKKITLRVLEELSEEERDEFEKVREQEDAERTENFLREKLPNYDEILEEVVSDFKKEMKEHIEEIKRGLDNN